uniref:XK-related protein n=1 Tax=Oreochromis niloticus TaxID=8128 RepID=A0A669E2U5_ORENI
MSGTQTNFKYSGWDFLFTCVGLPLYLVDIGLDIWTAVSFYKEKAYVCLAVLLVLLLGSSLLTQAYSWLWYSYDKFRMKTKVEGWPTKRLLKLLHVFQLGIYFRHAGVLEKAVESFRTKLRDTEGVAVFLSHDLSMLRIVETFSESAPQLTLMLTIILQQGHLDPVTVLKAIGSTLSIASFLTTYDHSMRTFLPEKEKHHMISLVFYFIWNLVLISSRIAALALFASVLPCFIFAHFICSWLVLFFFAWRSKTNFMDDPRGEWLYRTTVGLIWYFNWFSVAKGMRIRSMLYHAYILIDICILCGLWCWKMSTDPPDFVTHPLTTAACVVAVYILGLLFKFIYYTFFHPNLDKDKLRGATVTEEQPEDEERSHSVPSRPLKATDNKRMRKLAENFFC